MATKAEIDVARVARLARLDLTDDEAALFQEQLARVLEYAEKLREPDTGGMNNAGGGDTFDVLRQDEPRPWLTAKEALSGAPRQANDLFVVPKVVE